VFRRQGKRKDSSIKDEPVFLLELLWPEFGSMSCVGFIFSLSISSAYILKPMAKLYEAQTPDELVSKNNKCFCWYIYCCFCCCCFVCFFFLIPRLWWLTWVSVCYHLCFSYMVRGFQWNHIISAKGTAGQSFLEPSEMTNRKNKRYSVCFISQSSRGWEVFRKWTSSTKRMIYSRHVQHTARHSSVLLWQ